MQIKEVQLLTNNINDTENFYKDIIGLPVIEKKDNSISFAAGTSTLTFIKSDIPQPFYHFAFNIAPEKFEEKLTWAEKTLSLLITDTGLIADFVNWNAKAFYFLDNNNNIVEFITRYDLADENTEAFQSISEIGIVTDNVTAEIASLMKQYDIPVFSKQPPHEEFAAIGNDYGLFIVVSDQRKWYPTDILSAKFWSKIYFSNNGQTFEWETK